MTGKIKLTLILASVILVIVAVTTAGVSLALWTSQDGSGVGDSTNSVLPSVMPIDEYVWAKYFEYEVIKDESGNDTTNVVVTKFYTNDAGVNLEDVVIPSRFVETYTYTDENGKTQTANKVYITTRISSQVFMDMTLKKLPVTIYIPGTVIDIEGFAFSNLPNLQRIIFMPGEQPCVIKDYAFAFCQNLATIMPGTRELVGNETAFMGCGVSPTMTAPPTPAP